MRPPVRALLGAFLSLAVAAVVAPSTASAASSASSARRPAASSVPHALGAIPPTARVEASSVLKGLNGRARTKLALPASVDLSQNAPAIGDQGPVGSCAPW